MNERRGKPDKDHRSANCARTGAGTGCALPPSALPSNGRWPINCAGPVVRGLELAQYVEALPPSRVSSIRPPPSHRHLDRVEGLSRGPCRSWAKSSRSRPRRPQRRKRRARQSKPAEERCKAKRGTENVVGPRNYSAPAYAACSYTHTCVTPQLSLKCRPQPRTLPQPERRTKLITQWISAASS